MSVITVTSLMCIDDNYQTDGSNSGVYRQGVLGPFSYTKHLVFVSLQWLSFWLTMGAGQIPHLCLYSLSAWITEVMISELVPHNPAVYILDPKQCRPEATWISAPEY